MKDVNTISPQDAYNAIHKEGYRMIDVRTIEEFAVVHAQGVELFPLGETDWQAFAASLKEDENLFFICRSGQRSHGACQMLQIEGVETVWNVVGGTLAWQEAGLPVIEGGDV